MNQPKTIQPSLAPQKITKKEVDAALAAGHTHAKFKNKGVQKRLKKNHGKVQRVQQLRENQIRKQQKAEKQRREQEQQRQELRAKLMAASQATEADLDTGVGVLQALVAGVESLKATEVATQGGITVVGDRATGDVTITSNDPAVLEEIKQAAAEIGLEPEVVDPASIGDDLVDDNHNPENFGVQHASQDGLPDAFPVQMDKLTDNQVLLNLYGDENSYKPMPEVGDLIRFDGVVAGVRNFENGKPTADESIGLREIDYVHDTLCYSPSGKVIEVSEDGILVQNLSISNLDSEISNNDVAKIYPEQNVFAGLPSDLALSAPNIDDLPGDTISDKLAATFVSKDAMEDLGDALQQAADAERIEGVNRVLQKQEFNAALEAAIQSRPDGAAGHSIKVQNSSLSGAHIHTPLFSPGVHESLTAQCRAIRNEDVLKGDNGLKDVVGLHPSQAEVGRYVTTPKSEENGAPKMNPRSVSGGVYELSDGGAFDGIVKPEEALVQARAATQELDPVLQVRVMSTAHLELKPYCPASDMSEAETNRMIHGDDKPIDDAAPDDSSDSLNP